MLKQKLRAWSTALLATTGMFAGAAPAQAGRNDAAVERFAKGISDANLQPSQQPTEGYLFDGSKLVTVENESCDEEYALYVKNKSNGKAEIKAVPVPQWDGREKSVQPIDAAADLQNYIFVNVSGQPQLSSNWSDAVRVDSRQLIVDLSAAMKVCEGESSPTQSPPESPPPPPPEPTSPPPPPPTSPPPPPPEEPGGGCQTAPCGDASDYLPRNIPMGPKGPMLG